MPEKIVAPPPPTGCTIKGEPDYQPDAHLYRLRLDGKLVTGQVMRFAAFRYNIPEGWVEGRPCDENGHPETDHIPVRLHGVVTVEIPD